MLIKTYHFISRAYARISRNINWLNSRVNSNNWRNEKHLWTLWNEDVAYRITWFILLRRQKSMYQQFKILQNCSRTYYRRILQQQNTSEESFWNTILFFFFWADKNMTDFGFLTTYKIQGRIIIWWVLLVHNPKNPINWCRYTVGSKSI